MSPFDISVFDMSLFDIFTPKSIYLIPDNSLQVSVTNLSSQKSIEQTEVPKNKFRKALEPFLDKSGIQINGNSKWDLMINNEETFRRVVTEGSIGLGESYMDGWWDCESVDEFLTKILSSRFDVKLKSNWKLALDVIIPKLRNRQSRKRAFQVDYKHYDLDNNLFENMLDKRLTYSCGYWKNATTLDQAQENKLKLICDKIQLEPGMRVL
ncbi:MAG: class I SAM-dependent methyltransferase, partial [Candidatus Heimdallarchaeota archaeon]